MFHSRTLNNKINILHEKELRIEYSDNSDIKALSLNYYKVRYKLHVKIKNLNVIKNAKH